MQNHGNDAIGMLPTDKQVVSLFVHAKDVYCPGPWPVKHTLLRADWGRSGCQSGQGVLGQIQC